MNHISAIPGRILSAFCLWLWVSASASAAVFNVTQTSDGNAVTQLRGAILAANAAGPGPHTVNVPAGTYNLTLGTITFGTGAQDISIVGAGSAVTVINMTTTAQDRIFMINPPGTIADVVTSISGIKFTNGLLTSDVYGGGALICGGPGNVISITNCAFEGNSVSSASQYGGGAINMQGGGALIIDQCTFTGNTNAATAGGGGAIDVFLANLANLSGSVSITNCTFTGNSVTSSVLARGGAVAIRSLTAVSGQTFSASIQKNTFINNSVVLNPNGEDGGGAIYVSSSFPTNIHYNRFSGNKTGAAISDALCVSPFYPGVTNASNNWWGCNDDPAGTNACSDKAYLVPGSVGTGTLVTEPRLLLKTIPVTDTMCLSAGGNITTVTAGFLSNSTGQAVAPADLVRLIGLPVSFNAVKGVVSGAQASIQANGTATATFTGDGLGGISSVLAVVDQVPAGDTSPANGLIIIATPPVITAGNHPSDATVCAGSIAGFTVTPTSLVSTSYQWYRGTTALSNGPSGSGSVLSGANSASLSIQNSGVADLDNNYHCIVSSACGSDTSGNAGLSLLAVGNVLYVDSSIAVSGNGGDWNTALKTLAEAMDIMQVCTGVDSILVAKGTYYPTGIQNSADRDSAFTILHGGLKIYGGYPTGGGIRDITANPTILSGNIGDANNSTDNSYHVVVIAGLNASADSVVLDGLTITGGYAGTSTNKSYNSINVSRSNGGGIALVSASNGQKTSIRHCTFSGNYAGIGGGMVSNTSAPFVVNCIFKANVAITGGGMSYTTSSGYLVNCLFSGNQTLSGVFSGGAGINITSTATTPAIINCTFAGNHSQSGGGGIRLQGTSVVPIEPTIANTLIWGNSSGIDNVNATPAVTHSLVQGNAGGSNGNIDGTVSYTHMFVAAEPSATAPTMAGDYRLTECSPAINTATPDTTGLQLPAFDLDGHQRIFHNTLDMGAYEFQSHPPHILHVDSSVALSGDGSNWSNAFKTLAEAMNIMQHCQSIDSILVAKGTYYPTGVQSNTDRDSAFTILRGNVKILGGYENGGSGIRDIAANPTILSGNIGDLNDSTDNSHHVIVIAGVATGNITIEGFTITGGQAAGGTGSKNYNGHNINRNTGGGILLTQSNATTTLRHCTISGNYAGASGGGMHNTTFSYTLTHCIVSGNQANNSGGGIYNASNASTSLRIENSLLTGNHASGGAAVMNSGSSPVITGSTFAGNMSTSQGTIYNLNVSVSSLHNTLLWGNNNGVFSTGSGAAMVATHSLIQGNAGGSNGNLDGTATYSDMFSATEPATAAPTTAGDYRLAAGSPAINAGSNDSIPSGITTDLAGNLRIINSTVDIGAYEFNPCPVAFSTLYVDSSITTSGDGSSWAQAYKTFAEAALIANQCSTVHTILVAQGTYYPQYPANGTSTNPRDRAFVFTRDSLTILGGYPSGGGDRNWTANPVVLSGDIGTPGDSTDNTFHILITTGAVVTPALVIDGFTITGGNADSAGSVTVGGISVPRFNGGGMYNNASSPTLTHVVFTQNTANSGGGIYNNGGAPIFNTGVFTGNRAIGAGGAMVNLSSPATLYNTLFTANTANNGGAIANANISGNLRMTGCLFSGNSAANNGGAIENWNTSSTIINTTIAGNSATNGGGMLNASNSTSAIHNSIVYGNNTGITDISASVSNITYSLVQGLSSGTGNLNGNTILPGFHNPVSHTLAPTVAGNYRLTQCSPVINMGNPDTIGFQLPAFDMDSNQRIFHNIVDMGAYEFQSHLPHILHVDSSIALSGDGSNWSNAFKTLAEAMNMMQHCQSIDSILVAKGTYYPTGVQNSADRDSAFTILRGNIGIYGGYENGGSGIRDIAANPVILSGDIGDLNDSTDNSYHVMVVAGVTDDSVVVDGFTFVKGNADGTSAYKDYNGHQVTKYNGGGIHLVGNSNGGQTVFRNSILSGNYSEGLGGGIFNRSSSSVIIHCNISGNTGGGMYNINASPDIINCTFTGNRSSGGGGGMANSNSHPRITNCVFSGNRATSEGGGIYNSTSSPVITNCTFSGNHTNGNAGGIYSANLSSPTITNTIIWGNNTGIFTVTSSVVTITHSLIQGNAGGSNGNLDGTTTYPGMFIAAEPSSAAPTMAGDYTLVSCSPVVNAGINDSIPSGITTDLAGNPRRWNNGIVDMGAYEYQAVPAPVQGDTLTVAICVGGSYTFAAQVLTTTGYYHDTLQSVLNGCDSIASLHLLITPPLTGTETVAICQGQSYTFNGTSYTTDITGVYDTITNGNGCDSIVELQLTVNPYLTGTETVTICQGQSYTFNGIAYTASITGVYDTLTTVNCDSIVELQLTVNPYLTGTETVAICQGQSYTFNGITYTTSITGVYDTLTTVNCDSIVELQLTVNPYLTGTETVVICQGQSYTFNGISYTTDITGVYDTITNGNGCDSIVELQLTVNPYLTGTETVAICQGQSYTFNDMSYTTDITGVYDTLTTGGGCDSIVELQLTVNPYLTGTETVAICQGQSYTFNGITYTAGITGVYDTLTTANCDSIVELQLTVNPYLTGTETVAICQGQSYTFNGITYTTGITGVYDTITTGSGCDSIVELQLTVNPYLTGTETVTICQGQSYTFNGIAYTVSVTGVYDTITTGNCDSIVELQLTVNPYLTGTETVAICQGQSYTFNGITYTAGITGVYDTLTNGNGCDSIVELQLTVNPYLTGTETVAICQGQSYTFNDITYTTDITGVYDTLTTGNCDSIVELQLTVNPYLTGTETVTICQGQSYTFNGITYTTGITGVYDTITNGNGCDSIVELQLTVSPYLTGTETVAICQGQSYTWIDGNTYTVSNTTATYTTTNAAGCDSVITLNLTINQPTTSTDVQTACGSYTWIDGNTYTVSNNTATYTIISGSANGCDSIVTLNLTVLPLPAVTDIIPGTRCSEGSVTLVARGTPGAAIYWYDTPSGGTLLGSGGAFFTPEITSTTTYYAAAVTDCESVRLPVTATVSTTETGTGLA